MKHAMSEYRVAIAYEEGISISVEATDIESAEKKALELVAEHAGAMPDEFNPKTVHRDFFAVEVRSIP
jgi:hypothetical protein